MLFWEAWCILPNFSDKPFFWDDQRDISQQHGGADVTWSGKCQFVCKQHNYEVDSKCARTNPWLNSIDFVDINVKFNEHTETTPSA